MPSPFHINDKTMIVDNYDNALGIIKQKLYEGDYFTSTDSSINIAYNRTVHRYQVYPSKDISIPINENPRGKENFNTIRLLDIPTSSDDFDRYMESQIELDKVNHNLSEADYKIEQECELKKKLIDSCLCSKLSDSLRGKAQMNKSATGILILQIGYIFGRIVFFSFLYLNYNCATCPVKYSLSFIVGKYPS